MKFGNYIRFERTPVPLKVRKDDGTVPTREMLLRSQMSAMVTKLIEIYRFNKQMVKM